MRASGPLTGRREDWPRYAWLSICTCFLFSIGILSFRSYYHSYCFLCCSATASATSALSSLPRFVVSFTFSIATRVEVTFRHQYFGALIETSSRYAQVDI